MSYKLS